MSKQADSIENDLKEINNQIKTALEELKRGMLNSVELHLIHAIDLMEGKKQ